MTVIGDQARDELIDVVAVAKDPVETIDVVAAAQAPGKAIDVVAAAIIRSDGRVLIAQRLAGKHLAGGWEFPGGKLEPGETRTAALERELREELGIVIHDPRPLMRLRHVYPHGEVLLDIWVVERYEGEPRGMDGQALRWCTHDELAAADLLPADRPIVEALRSSCLAARPLHPQSQSDGRRGQ